MFSFFMVHLTKMIPVLLLIQFTYLYHHLLSTLLSFFPLSSYYHFTFFFPHHTIITLLSFFSSCITFILKLCFLLWLKCLNYMTAMFFQYLLFKFLLSCYISFFLIFVHECMFKNSFAKFIFSFSK